MTLKIKREIQSFGVLSPNDTFRQVLEDHGDGYHSLGNLCMVVKDGEYNKAYDLEEKALLSMKRTTEVVKVLSELVIRFGG